MVAPISPTVTTVSALSPALELAPSDEWTVDELGKYAAAQIAQTDSIEASLSSLIRRSVISYYRAGQALYFARKRLKAGGDWCDWQKSHGLPRNSMLTYIKLYERASPDGGEDAISGMTLQQAKEHYGIGKAKTADEKATVEAAKVKATRARSPLGSVKGDPDDPLALAKVALTALGASAASAAVNSPAYSNEWVGVLREIENKLEELVAVLRAKPRSVPSGETREASADAFGRRATAEQGTAA